MRLPLRVKFVGAHFFYMYCRWRPRRVQLLTQCVDLPCEHILATLAATNAVLISRAGGCTVPVPDVLYGGR